MALRLVEIVIPENERDWVLKILHEHESDPDVLLWTTPIDNNRLSLKIIIDVHETENMLDVIEKRFSFRGDKYRIVIYPVAATIPRLEKEEEKEEIEKKETARKEKHRISREELYASILDMARCSRSYCIMVLLSAIVAAIGLLRDNVAVIIGAMVIAPLLGPNVGISLATALGDQDLAKESLKTALVGGGLALVVAVSLGLVLHVDPVRGELAGRTVISLSDVILALAAGAAGIFSVTQGVPTIMVGVMVALALLPPLVAAGLLLGSGQFHHFRGAAMLFAGNIIGLNLAGVLTFFLQGVQPLSWGEKKRAKRLAVKAALTWLALLCIFTLIVLYSYYKN